MHREAWVMLFTFFSAILYSQEKSIYDQAFVDPFLINPAATGTELFPVARLSVEKRWIGFDDSPSTILLTGNTRFGNYGFYTPRGLVNKGPFRVGNKIAFGGAVYYNKNGPINNAGALLSYAYHLPVSRSSRLSMGLSVYLLNRSLNTSRLLLDQPDDDYLLNEQNNLFRANFGLGLFYHTNNFFAGFSATELLPMETTSSYEEIKMPAFYLIAGYKINRVVPLIDFEPSVIMNSNSEEDLSIDLYAKLYYMSFHWVAVSYSTARKAEIIIALKLYNSFYLGYNYVYNTGRIASYQYGSHIISIGINMGMRGTNSLDYNN